MTDDIVIYLRERQEAWQDEINPQALTLADNELWEVTKKAVENEDFLFSLRPGLLVRLANIMAAQVVVLLESKLESGSLESQPTTLQ